MDLNRYTVFSSPMLAMEKAWVLIYSSASLGFFTFYLGNVIHETDVGVPSNDGFSCLIMFVVYAFWLCGGYQL